MTNHWAPPPDARGRRIALVAHCLLNANSTVEGLASYPAIHPIVGEFAIAGVGLIQLPCPELLGCGMRRWGQTVEQLDFPAFQALARRLAGDVAASVAEFVRCGYAIVGVVGIEGSPSCGVSTAASGNWGGEPEPAAWAETVSQVGLAPRPGVFLTALHEQLDALSVPFVPAPDARDADACRAVVRRLTGDASEVGA